MEQSLFKTSLQYMFKDNKFLNKFAVLFVITLLCALPNFFENANGNTTNAFLCIIIGLIAFVANIYCYGYMSACIKALSEQNSNYMLPFFDFKTHGVIGLKWLVAAVFFGLAAGVVIAIAGAIAALLVSAIPMLSNVILVLAIIAAVVFIVIIGIYCIAFFRMFAVTQDIFAFFKFKEIFKSVRDNEKTYFKGWGSLILLGIAFTILAIMLGVLCAFFGEAFKFVLGILISVAATYYNMVFMYLCAKCIK